ncbi:MAG: type II toxin-antitoxin system VapC family toxin [Candidatus Dadabacteria bacterium]|nr:type II toxin-antitoxin system VapC family toxin [Candidatus Dadabacteria bacterium]
MNYVLDTHALLWILAEDGRMSRKAKRLFLDKSNTIFLSIASIWEMAIKISLGKLALDEPLEAFVKNHVERNDIKILEIAPHHIYPLEDLPFHHRDPFDRLIIAQCMTEGFSIICSDKAFDDYPVSRVW